MTQEKRVVLEIAHGLTPLRTRTKSEYAYAFEFLENLPKRLKKNEVYVGIEPEAYVHQINAADLETMQLSERGRIHFIRGVGERLPIKDSAVHEAHVNEFFHSILPGNIENYLETQMLAEIKRVLMEGGKLVLGIRVHPQGLAEIKQKNAFARLSI